MPPRRLLRRGFSPQKAALAEKAVGEGIPINLHQLTDSKAAKLAGEYAETIPARDRSASNVAWRSPTPSPARLIPSPRRHCHHARRVRRDADRRAGGEIGNIMARYEVTRHVR